MKWQRAYHPYLELWDMVRSAGVSSRTKLGNKLDWNLLNTLVYETGCRVRGADILETFLLDSEEDEL